METAGAAPIAGDFAEGVIVWSSMRSPTTYDPAADPAAPRARQLSRTEWKAPSADTDANSFQTGLYPNSDSV
jgi:hypothetical protein